MAKFNFRKNKFVIDAPDIEDLDNAKELPAAAFGVKIHNQHGWCIYITKKEETDLVSGLRSKDLDIVSVQKIGSDIHVFELSDEEADIENGDIDLNLIGLHVRRQGWSFDESINAWRAPGEAKDEPQRNAKEAKQFDEESALDGIFWNLVVTIDGHVTTIKTDFGFYEYNPVPGLIRWLEEVIEERATQVLFDDYWHQSELTAYPMIDGLVQLSIRNFDIENDHPHVDYQIRIFDLVKQIYTAIKSLSKHKIEILAYLNSYGEVEETELPLSSEKIDDFLKGLVHQI